MDVIDAAPAGPDQWLRSYAEANEALQLDDELVQASYDEAKPDIFGGVLLTLDGEEHRQRRRLEQRLFSPRTVRAYDREVLPRLVTAHVAETGDEVFDLVEIGRLITTSFATMMVGIDDCVDRPRVERLAELMAFLHAGVVVRWSTRPHAEVLAEARAAKDAFAREFFGPSIARRRTQRDPADSGRPVDLLSLLVQQSDQLDWSEEQYLREAVHFLIASAHTAGNAVVHAVADVERWVERHPDDLSSITDPEFLARCAAETFRLRVPTSAAYRSVVTDVVLTSTGRVLHKGELIGVDLVSASRDAELFGTNAADFDPYRRTANATQAYGLSFSAGAHNCPGRQLAAGTGPARSRGEGVRSAAVHGIVARIMAGLYEAGAAPAGEPEVNPDSERRQYRHYPMRLYGRPRGRR